MKGPGMMVALLNEKKGKASEPEEEAPPSSRSGSEMEDDRAEELAGEAFDALREEDREAFSQALLSLIYHCR